MIAENDKPCIKIINPLPSKESDASKSHRPTPPKEPPRISPPPPPPTPKK